MHLFSLTKQVNFSILEYMKKDLYFNNDTIRYEAITQTPLWETAKDLNIDRQVEAGNIIFDDVANFCQRLNLTVCRTSWELYCAEADWENLIEKIKP